MSIFGKMDAANVPSNPYWVEKGEYSGEVSAASYKNNRDGQRQLVIQYMVTDEDSQFNNSKVTQYFTLPDPNMTLEDFELLPPDQKQAIRKTMSAVKRTLCGNDANTSQRGLGVDPDDLNNDDWDPAVLVGTKVNFGVSNYGSNNEGVNVRWVNIVE